MKRVQFESRLLSKFCGQPMYLGATILLPKGYDSHPDARYPLEVGSKPEKKAIEL